MSLSRRYEVAAETEDVLFSFAISFELKSNAFMSVFIFVLLLRPVLLCYSMQVRAL